jgi:hypothetical protein
MAGSLLFTYLYSDDFGYDVRQWRLFADVANDLGLTLHFLAPLFGRDWFVAVTCVASLLTTMCGISAGATKAYISSHFALENNLTDLIAKEGSQETAVNILGLLGGYLLLASVGTVDQSGSAIWMSFFLLTIIHVVANVIAVQYLVFHFLNETRFSLVVQSMLDGVGEDGSFSCAAVASREPLLPVTCGCWRRRGKDLRTTSVLLGSNHRLLDPSSVNDGVVFVDDDATSSASSASSVPRFVVVHEMAKSTGGSGGGRLHVLLHETATFEDVLRGRFSAERLARTMGVAGHERKDASLDGWTWSRFRETLVGGGWDVHGSVFRVGRTRYGQWSFKTF